MFFDARAGKMASFHVFMCWFIPVLMLSFVPVPFEFLAGSVFGRHEHHSFCAPCPRGDAFPGYDKLYASGRIIEAGCSPHARRKFHDIHAKQPTPVTTHVLEQIAAIYWVESAIRGQSPPERQAVRQAQGAPILTALHAWLREQLRTVARKSTTAEVMGYALNHWQALTRFLGDGRIEADNNAAERALRGIALGKNYLFLGSDAGGERAATLYSLLGTGKLNGINPEAYLRHVLTVIADHPVNRVDELLPWNVTL